MAKELTELTTPERTRYGEIFRTALALETAPQWSDEDGGFNEIRVMMKSSASPAVITGEWLAKLVNREGGNFPLTAFGASPAHNAALNTTLLQAALIYCRDRNLSWYLPPGDYLTTPLKGWTGGRADGRLVIENNPAYGHCLEIAPLDADIVELSLEFINSLTIQRGVKKLAALAPYYGYAVSIANYADEAPLKRINGNIRWIEPFIVHQPDGSFYPPFANTKTVPWTSRSAFAVKIRSIIQIQGLEILIKDTGAGGLGSGFKTSRPNVIYSGCSVTSESGLPVSQGFVTERGGSLIRYIVCRVQGLLVDSTNYGWNFSTADIVLDACSQANCRRGQDAHGGKQIQILGGSYPDGVGGHWVHGLSVTGGAYLSSRPSNTAPVHASGSNVRVKGNTIHLPPDQHTVMSVRNDIFEMRGVFACDDNEITIDCSENQSATKYLMRISFASLAAGHDWGRMLYMPDQVSFSKNRIKQKDAGFTGGILLLELFGGPSSANMGASAGGNIEITGNAWDLDAGDIASDGFSRLAFNMNKSLGGWNAGQGYRVLIEDLPSLKTFIYCGSTVVNKAAQRCDFRLDRIGTLTWLANYGTFKTARLGADLYTYKIGELRPSGGGTANTNPIGDEQEVKTQDLAFYLTNNFSTITAGQSATATFTGLAGVTEKDLILAAFHGVAPGWDVDAKCYTNGQVQIRVTNHTGADTDPPTSSIFLRVFRT